MIWTLACSALLFGAAAPAFATGEIVAPGQTQARKWQPFELQFEGPFSMESDDPTNPFLDYRLQVEFVAPSGAVFDVPGFFDGDAAGSGVGTMWKVRFAADEIGMWNWTASFRKSDEVAVSLDPSAGFPVAFDGATGSVNVVPEAAFAPGFLAHGRLQYVGEHHLQHQDGTWFLKTGTNSPENLLGFSGFDGVVDLGGAPQGIVHDYAPHVADWNPGNPEVGAAGSPNGLKGIIGALNYLSEVGVNSVYFLPMNLGGDGQETAPFLAFDKSHYANTHYDTSRLAQWNTVMEHAIQQGIQLQIVLSETESENEDWLDDGQFGPERKLYFRELVARFGHNLAIKWNLAEENDYGIANLLDMAEYLQAIDPYDHPICVHTHVDDFEDYFALLGDPRFSATSIQYTNSKADEWTEDWRANSAGAGRKWIVDLDENGTAAEGVSDQNAVEMRKEVLYDVLFSGGGIEWYLGSGSLPLGGDQSLEDFRTRDDMWRYSRIAREFLEENLEFWRMEPADELLVWESPAYGGAEVFAFEDRDFAIYLPDASQGGALDLSGMSFGVFWTRWYDPRLGDFAGPITYLDGGAIQSLGDPPYDVEEDWLVLVRRMEFYPDRHQISVTAPSVQNLYLDAGTDHADETYWILGTISGVWPGVSIFDVHVPLNPDGWMVWLVSNVNTAVAQGFAGTLSHQGRAMATFDPTSGLHPSLIGLTFNHAYVAGTGTSPSWASNPVALELVP